MGSFLCTGSSTTSKVEREESLALWSLGKNKVVQVVVLVLVLQLITNNTSTYDTSSTRGPTTRAGTSLGYQGWDGGECNDE